MLLAAACFSVTDGRLCYLMPAVLLGLVVLAAALFELKNYDAAIASAKHALGSSRFRVPANVIIADAYEGLKQDGWKELAIAHYKKGLKDRRYQKYCEDKIDRILNPMGQTEGEAQ